jgi:hypothetical protein
MCAETPDRRPFGRKFRARVARIFCNMIGRRVANESEVVMRVTTCLLTLGLLTSLSSLVHPQTSSAVFTSFDFPGSNATSPGAITPNGKIVGDYVGSDGNQHGFLLEDGSFQTIDFPGSTRTTVRWINANGRMVGEYTDSAGNVHAYLLTGGRFTSFDYPDAASTVAFGIGNSGDIVGPWTSLPFTFHGYLLRRRSFTTIEYPGAMWTLPTMIVGQKIVGGWFDTNFTSHGFLLDLNTNAFEEIRCLGYSSVFLSGINPLGDMTGGFNSSDGVLHGLLVRNGNCISIDFPGATSTYANSENPDGTILGRYTSPDGKIHGYLLTGMR